MQLRVAAQGTVVGALTLGLAYKMFGDYVAPLMSSSKPADKADEQKHWDDDVVLLLIIVYLTWKLVVYTLYCPYMHKYSYMTVWADVLERV